MRMAYSYRLTKRKLIDEIIETCEGIKILNNNQGRTN